jgi:transcription-repair coupling factor (superfamily II helicase)
VRRAVRDIARDLVELYAARQDARGHAFPPDGAWQREMEAAFPFVETPDQLRAIGEVKADMEAERPMDRLLVGDVGYGKTEVANRAAFKVVNDGRQVGVLVPTTGLAQQHFATFRERLAAFPVRVEMLSRFLSDREQREVLDGLRSGAVDIVIGTHRLVQKDVGFKDLGLVIIDEEQRFGVAHKERLKQLRREVDVLTLTATPIPRTLHMSLAGVRDMSTMETAPEDRLPIRTFVQNWDDAAVREAILREIDRGGQIYFVHNRVQGIEQVAARLARLVPEARVCVGHGQMQEEQLEQVMLRFSAGECDVLVCTTIIESGLDIPNVNTIVVNQAHRFGLSQLYQLRGRVGRGAARAYAYLLWGSDTGLTEEAEKRLRTIFEATELGAGFRIAMKDLEIRGAGNLLGAEQHGNIGAVGFELYTRMLGEAVQQLKSARDGTAPPTPEPEVTTSLDLPLSAYIPDEYVADDQARLSLYQRLAALRSAPELAPLVEELEDRFGPLPREVQNLIYLVSLRLRAARAGVREIAAPDGEVLVRFAGAPPAAVRVLGRQLKVALSIGSNQIRFPRGRGESWLATLDAVVEALPRA